MRVEWRSLLLAGAVTISMAQAPPVRHVSDYLEYAKLHQQFFDQSWSAFNREIARESIHPASTVCENVGSHYDIGDCLQREIDTTTANYEEYAAGLRALTGLHLEGLTDPRGEPTPEQKVKEFDDTEAAWQEYQKHLCSAAGNQISGTAAPMFTQRCYLNSTRTHLRELDAIIGQFFSGTP